MKQRSNLSSILYDLKLRKISCMRRPLPPPSSTSLNFFWTVLVRGSMTPTDGVCMKTASHVATIYPKREDIYGEVVKSPSFEKTF